MKVSDECHPGVNIFISSHKSLNRHRETAEGSNWRGHMKNLTTVVHLYLN